MADTPTGETVTPGDSQTTVQTSAPTQGNAVDPAEVERLRKEKEQADLRIRQLENEKKAREEKEEAERLKQLEENNEWKQIAEQNKARAEALEAERKADETKRAVEAAQTGVFSEFSNDVIELAKDTGLTLTDDSDEAKEALRSKLQKLNARLSGDRQPRANNPGPQSNNPERVQLVEGMRRGDPEARRQVIAGLSVIEQMRKDSGFTRTEM